MNGEHEALWKYIERLDDRTFRILMVMIGMWTTIAGGLGAVILVLLQGGGN